MTKQPKSEATKTNPQIERIDMLAKIRQYEGTPDEEMSVFRRRYDKTISNKEIRKSVEEIEFNNQENIEVKTQEQKLQLIDSHLRALFAWRSRAKERDILEPIGEERFVVSLIMHVSQIKAEIERDGNLYDIFEYRGNAGLVKVW